MRDALHQTTIAEKYPSVMIDNGMTIAIELRCQRLFGDRHPNRIGQTLAQRARRGLNTRRIAELGVPGRLAMQLPELLDVFDRQLVTGEV